MIIFPLPFGWLIWGENEEVEQQEASVDTAEGVTESTSFQPENQNVMQNTEVQQNVESGTQEVQQSEQVQNVSQRKGSGIAKWLWIGGGIVLLLIIIALVWYFVVKKK